MNARKIVAVLCLLMGAGRMAVGVLYLILGGPSVSVLDYAALGDAFLSGPVIFIAGYMLLRAANEEAKRQQKEN